MCSPHQPDTSAQQAEAQREAAIQEQYYQQQLAQQQDEWTRERADAEQRYQQQLQMQQAEIDRQAAIQKKSADDAEALRQQQIQQAADTARRARDFASQRDTAVSSAADEVNKAYGGFDDAYYQNFAQQFLAANRGDVDTNYQRGQRAMTYKLADARNLNSSAAADAFGELGQDYQSGLAKVTNQASDKADALKAQISGQKSSALNAIYGLGNTAVPDFQTDTDETSALSRIRQSIQGLTSTYLPTKAPAPTSYA